MKWYVQDVQLSENSKYHEVPSVNSSPLAKPWPSSFNDLPVIFHSKLQETTMGPRPKGWNTRGSYSCLGATMSSLQLGWLKGRKPTETDAFQINRCNFMLPQTLKMNQHDITSFGGNSNFFFGLVRKDFKGVLGAHHEQHVHFFDPSMERSFASTENHVCIATSKNKSKYKIIIYIYIIIYI
jgi:hypothetical protein